MNRFFDDICRLCLQNMSTKISIFLKVDIDNSLDKNEDSIDEIIKFCTGMNISSEDELPKCICVICLNDLKNFTMFRRKCLSSQDVLEDILKQQQYEMKLSEYDDNGEGTEESEILELENIHKRVEEIFISSDRNDQKEAFQTEDDYEFTIIEIFDENESAEDTYKIEKNDEENVKLEDLKDTVRKRSVKKHRKSPEENMSRKIIKLDQTGNKPRIRKERQCQVCGKMFRRISSHMLFHNDIKKHKCSMCDKSFKLSCNLKQHMYIHLNTRPYKCKYCERAFNSQQSLKAHEIHHSGEKNHECNVCGRKFAYSTTLRYHKKVHNQIRQHKCSECGKEFITKHALKKHILIHTGEKPYECKVCGKRFNNTGGIYLHKKTHTKEISFNCKKCNLGFVYKSTFNSHLRRCHKNEDNNENENDV